MDPTFVAQYAERGRTVQLMGVKVETMSQEELYAVIGYLCADNNGDDAREATSSGEHPDFISAAVVNGDDYPPANNGLLEG